MLIFWYATQSVAKNAIRHAATAAYRRTRVEDYASSFATLMNTNTINFWFATTTCALQPGMVQKN
jgi:hypothetical protein